jgi:hypothetical protein
MAGQGQKDFFFHQVIQLNGFINQPKVEILSAQFMLLFIAPRDTARKSLGKLHINRKFNLYQTTATGYRNLCMQITADVNLAGVASNLTLDANRFD